jgi:hypothetical protein
MSLSRLTTSYDHDWTESFKNAAGSRDAAVSGASNEPGRTGFAAGPGPPLTAAAPRCKTSIVVSNLSADAARRFGWSAHCHVFRITFDRLAW